LIDVGDVYQGTEVSLRSKGELMIDCSIISNTTHGLSAITSSTGESSRFNEPCNDRQCQSWLRTRCWRQAGRRIFGFTTSIRKIPAFILKEIAGIKIAIIGVTTPGMPFWFRPEFARGIEFQYPVEPVRRAIARAKSEGANTIVLTGHMGLKARSGGDDFANAVMALTSEFPEVAVFIAGHTHQVIPTRLTNGVLLTQADHFGIHTGRVDLLFDRNSKKLLHREAICELMDSRFRFDHVVISRAKSQLAESEAHLRSRSANWPRRCIRAVALADQATSSD
jgi:hypothetical protein